MSIENSSNQIGQVGVDNPSAKRTNKNMEVGNFKIGVENSGRFVPDEPTTPLICID